MNKYKKKINSECIIEKNDMNNLIHKTKIDFCVLYFIIYRLPCNMWFERDNVVYKQYILPRNEGGKNQETNLACNLNIIHSFIPCKNVSP